jgi:hypothetical protein
MHVILSAREFIPVLQTEALRAGPYEGALASLSNEPDGSTIGRTMLTCNFDLQILSAWMSHKGTM